MNFEVYNEVNGYYNLNMKNTVTFEVQVTLEIDIVEDRELVPEIKEELKFLVGDGPFTEEFGKVVGEVTVKVYDGNSQLVEEFSDI
jgi:hypothetical protein